MKQVAIGIAVFLVISIGHMTVAQNTLTKKEKAQGWKLLFDGKTTTGWRKFNSNTTPPAWKVVDGTLFFDNTAVENAEKCDIITDAEYENYELLLEWKIDSCGNSGIMFNVIEDPKYTSIWQTGPEMQILDNSCHPDAKIEKHRAGDLYDLIKCSKETVNPAGQWNQVRILSNKAKYEFWLNGAKVVEFTMHTPAWEEMVKNSKFKAMPDFGKATKGHIALQDHNDKVWFRNIKIRELK
jgi:hypothetical protein